MSYVLNSYLLTYLLTPDLLSNDELVVPSMDDKLIVWHVMNITFCTNSFHLSVLDTHSDHEDTNSVSYPNPG